MYKIINCERSLKQFIATLPKLKNGEVFFGALQSRNKYSENSISDSQVAKIVGNKETLFNKISKTEIKKGLYVDLKSGTPLVDTELVAMMNINPRDLDYAGYNTINSINSNQLARKKDPKQKIMNPLTAAYSTIQNSRGTKHITDVDIDVTDKQKFNLKALVTILHETIGMLYVRSIIETRGGYHVQVNDIRLPEAIRKRWSFNLKNKLSEVEGVKYDFQSDCMTPIVGCRQGDFVPVMVYFSEFGVVLGTGRFWDSFTKQLILDPDGFDRSDYDWSFNRELMLYDEFVNRQMFCTVMVNNKAEFDDKMLKVLTTKGDNINNYNDLLSNDYEGVFVEFVAFKKTLDNKTTQHIKKLL